MNKALADIGAGFKDAWSWSGLGATLGLILLMAVLAWAFGLADDRIAAKLEQIQPSPFQIPGL